MSRRSCDTTNRPRTLAWFEAYDDVRAAAIELERDGIDAVDISVSRPSATTGRRDIDRRAFGWIGRRALIGAVVGAIAGALMGALVGALLNGWTATVWYFVVGGAVFGLAPGFFYSVGSRLPAAPETFDTFGLDEGGRACVAVSGDADVRRRAADTLRDLGATRIEERS